MKDPCVIGVDFGTDSARAVVVNAKNGQVLGAGVHAYRRWAEGRYCAAEENRFRQHPLDHIEAMESAVKQALKQAPRGCGPQVKGLAVDTTGSTPGPVDKSGRPLALRPQFKDNPDAMFLLWKDHTSIKEAAEINERAADWGGENYTKYVGGIYSSEWFWAKLLHVTRKNPAVGKAAWSWVEFCDWIPALLTGVNDASKIKRGRCAAGHKAMWHPQWNGLPSEEFICRLDPRLKGLRARLFEDSQTADKCVGTLSPEWAKRLGLDPSVKVAGGAFDVHMGVVGGGIRPYMLAKVMGTSTCDIVMARPADLAGKAVKGICGQVEGSVMEGMVGMEAGQSAVGDIYAWFAKMLMFPLEGRDKAALKLKDKISSGLIPRLEKEAAALPVDPEAAMALDWMNGRRTPDANQALKGVIANLNLASNAPRVYRALVEATAFGARRIVERFREEGVRVEKVIAMGGVAKKSALVMQTHADVFNMPVKVVRSEQACALGASIFAAVCAGLYPKVEDAQAAMESDFEKEYRPIPKNARAYQEIFEKNNVLAGLIEIKDSPRPAFPKAGAKFKELKRQAFEANLQLPRLGLVIYTFGNVSALDAARGVFAIKPSGVDYHDLRPEDMVVVDLEGKKVEGRLAPSSDTLTHAVLYRKFEGLGGIVHTHSTYAVAWAQAGRDIPVLGTTHADHLPVAVPCTRWMESEMIKGDYEKMTGEVIVECFRKRNLKPSEVPMALVAGHGPFTWGADARAAVYNARILEELAKMALRTLQINPGAPTLPEALITRHFQRKHGKNATYGQEKPGNPHRQEEAS